MNPIERKVKAATGTAAVTGAAVWALTTYVPFFADGIPEPVQTALAWAVATVLAGFAGWWAKHTDRPDLR